MLFQSNSAASALDPFLRQKIQFFQILPQKPLAKNSNLSQVELGKRLFMEVDLSGNKNISCMTCHNPMSGLSDALPLSRTENSDGILRRNSQSLFNLANKSFMFWDGRVHFDQTNKIFTTPDPLLSSEISSVMTSALSAQALFPMLSREEMRGKPGDNEIADAKSNDEAWKKIVIRLKNQQGTSRLKSYSELFRQAYPNTPLDKINIGHVGESIAAFEKEQFQSTGSPFNRYLLGDDDALSEQQKRGFALFVDGGKCIACHQGGELGLNTFFASVGVPQWGAEPLIPDIGRGEIGNETFRKFFFRTPSLLNVGLTAPYMHNGAFATLRDVINHYSNIKSSLKNYQIPDTTRDSMPVVVGVEKNPDRLQDVWNSIQAPFLRQGLNFSEGDKDDLEAFLSEGLTDPKWKVQ